MEVRSSFISQLSDYERRLTEQGIGPKTGSWNEVKDQLERPLLTCEEFVLRNTYLNAQMGPITQYTEQELAGKDQFELKWIDNHANDKEKLTTNPSEDDLCLKEEADANTVHKEEKQLKSIIKIAKDQNMFTTD